MLEELRVPSSLCFALRGLASLPKIPAPMTLRGCRRRPRCGTAPGPSRRKRLLGKRLLAGLAPPRVESRRCLQLAVQALAEFVEEHRDIRCARLETAQRFGGPHRHVGPAGLPPAAHRPTLRQPRLRRMGPAEHDRCCFGNLAPIAGPAGCVAHKISHSAITDSSGLVGCVIAIWGSLRAGSRGVERHSMLDCCRARPGARGLAGPQRRPQLQVPCLRRCRDRHCSRLKRSPPDTASIRIEWPVHPGRWVCRLVATVCYPIRVDLWHNNTARVCYWRSPPGFGLARANAPGP